MTLKDYNGSSGGRVDNLEPSTNVLGTGEGTYKAEESSCLVGVRKGV